MPFVVTTKRPCPACVHGPAAGGEHRPESASRRAVATLEEARVEAGRVVDRAEPFGGAPYGVWAGWRDDVALRLPESGGTVGPLPDGTLIKVERTDWVRLAYDAGMRGRVLASSQQLGEVDKVLQPFPPHAEIIDAFNARQSA